MGEIRIVFVHSENLNDKDHMENIDVYVEG
jgi:hypothetical protein